MPAIRILDSTGDTVIEWSTKDPHSVERARRTFCQLHEREGRIAFAVPPEGTAGDSVQIREFDPSSSDDVLFVRPLQGG